MLSFIFQTSGRCESTFLKFGSEGAKFFNTMKIRGHKKVI